MTFSKKELSSVKSGFIIPHGRKLFPPFLAQKAPPTMLAKSHFHERLQSPKTMALLFSAIWPLFQVWPPVIFPGQEHFGPSQGLLVNEAWLGFSDQDLSDQNSQTMFGRSFY
jgi:hypothetical protein